jgi:hypothetical protein
MIKFVVPFLMLFFLHDSETFGQQSLPDTVILQSARVRAREQYHLFEAEQSRLFNGKLYRDYTIPLTEGHPYYSTENFQTGTILYDGISFNAIPLLYNIVTDEVITPHYNKVQWVSLRNDKIASFSFGGHHFIRITADTTNQEGITTGIYEQLYPGKTEAIKKKTKFVVESISNNKLVRNVKVIERRFLWHNDTWHRVTSLRTALKVLGEHNAAIRQQLRSAKIKYRRAPDVALARIAEYYDVLTAGK